MKGYKGFNKDLKCRDKQYAIGETFEEESAGLCKKGMHFCEYPLDCFKYYPPAENRFAEIEAEGVSNELQEDSKRTAKKITVKGELPLKGIIEAAIKFTFDRAVWGDADKATGDQGVASATGYQGAASATGSQGAASAAGDRGAASATGDRGAASATGYQGAASATGYQGAASATGDRGAAAATGYQGAASVTGKNSAAMAIGRAGRAAGALGCWIVLAEWEQDENEGWHMKEVKAVQVDGEKIKPDTFYTLRNGGFVEKGGEA
jgi:hypothetical protein